MRKKKKLKRVDYSIEYAHIYADKEFGIEQKKSIEVLRKTLARLKKLNKNYSLSVLVDEYNSTDLKLDIKKFVAKLGKLGVCPDFICFESELIKYSSLLLGKTTSRIRKEYSRYIMNHNKFPCSFLIAIWYLKRLGIIKSTEKELDCVSGVSRESFTASKIITILPTKYRGVELKALEIIGSTPFKRRLTDIVDIFF